MSSVIFARAWERSRASDDALLVLLAMADDADPVTGVCALDRERVMRKARVSASRLEETLRSLEDAGEIVRVDCELDFAVECFQILVAMNGEGGTS